MNILPDIIVPLKLPTPKVEGELAFDDASPIMATQNAPEEFNKILATLNVATPQAEVAPFPEAGAQRPIESSQINADEIPETSENVAKLAESSKISGLIIAADNNPHKTSIEPKLKDATHPEQQRGNDAISKIASAPTHETVSAYQGALQPKLTAIQTQIGERIMQAEPLDNQSVSAKSVNANEKKPTVQTPESSARVVQQMIPNFEAPASLVETKPAPEIETRATSEAQRVKLRALPQTGHIPVKDVPRSTVSSARVETVSAVTPKPVEAPLNQPILPSSPIATPTTETATPDAPKLASSVSLPEQKGPSFPDENVKNFAALQVTKDTSPREFVRLQSTEITSPPAHRLTNSNPITAFEPSVPTPTYQGLPLEKTVEREQVRPTEPAPVARDIAEAVFTEKGTRRSPSKNPQPIPQAIPIERPQSISNRTVELKETNTFAISSSVLDDLSADPIFIAQPELAVAPTETKLPTTVAIAQTTTQPQEHPRFLTANAASISEAIIKVNESGGKVDVTLAPEDLGRLTVKLDQTTHGPQLTFSAERFETQEIMRRHLDTLHNQMKAMGFDNLSFAFSEDRGNSTLPNKNQSEQGQAFGTKEGQPSREEQLDTLLGQNGLDIRI